MSDWCDAVYAILAEVPHDVLTRLRDRMTTVEAIIDPVRARETWGQTADHVAMAGTLETDGPAETRPAPRPQDRPPPDMSPIPSGGPTGRR